jgi:hypothetical protein
MSQSEHHHQLADLAAVATLGLGAYFLWKKFHHPAPAPHPDDVMMCLQAKPNWGLPQCQQRLHDLKDAAVKARNQLAAITAGRDRWIELGNIDMVKQIDAQAGPWQLALDGLQHDYFNLTGSQL